MLILQLSSTVRFRWVVLFDSVLFTLFFNSVLVPPSCSHSTRTLVTVNTVSEHEG